MGETRDVVTCFEEARGFTECQLANDVVGVVVVPGADVDYRLCLSVPGERVDEEADGAVDVGFAPF